jgi:hypothetical protein
MYEKENKSGDIAEEKHCIAFSKGYISACFYPSFKVK